MELTPRRVSRFQVAHEPRRRPLLVIDDDASFLANVREVLGSAGFEVEGARQGFLAGHLVRRLRPAAVLLDVVLPGLDGIETLALLRRGTEGRALPVIACTSLRATGVEARLRSAGFDAYLPKPIEPRALLDALARLAP